EAVGRPEVTEGHDYPGERLEGVGPSEGAGQSLADLAASCQVVVESLQQPGLRAELVIDGHPGDAGLARDGVDAEAGGTRTGDEKLAGGREDARPRLFGRCLALAEPVGARAHRSM